MPQKWIDIILGTRETSFVIFDAAFADRILRNLPCHQRFDPTIAKDDQVHESKILRVLENLRKEDRRS